VIAFCGAAALATGMLVRARLGTRGLVSALLGIWLLFYAQVVLLAEVLSEAHALGRAGFVVGHLLLLGLSVWVWRSGGRPPAGFSWRTVAADVMGFVRDRPAVSLFAAAILLLGAANMAWAFRYPPLAGDSNAYHLPRAYYWLQLATARHFPTSDFRMTEMPPNPSFVFLWILSLTKGFRGLHLPQASAAFAVAIAVVGVSRLAGFGRGAALFAGAMTLTFPMVLVQMASAQTDLLAAATGLCALYFGLKSLWPGPTEGSDAILFGVAVGLGLGTKLTLLFLLPGLGCGLLLVALVSGNGAWRRLGRLVAAATIGFALFGAYNYVLNVLDFGRPVASRTGWELVYAPRPAWQYDRVGNAFRYFDQILDEPGLGTDGSLLPRLQDRAFRVAGRILQVNVDFGTEGATVRAARFAPTEEESGFGPAGFLVVLAAPVCLLAAAWAVARGGCPTGRAIEAAVLVTGFGWPAAFLVANQPWSSSHVRYFLCFVPILSAVVFPRLVGRSSFRRLLPAVLAALSLFVAAAVIRAGPGGVRRGAWRDQNFGAALKEEVITSLVGSLPASFPAGATLGVASEFNDVVFHLFRSLPAFRFVPVAEEQIPALLRAGRIEGALVGQFRNERGQAITRPGIPLPRNVLVTADPTGFFREHPVQYGLSFEGGQKADLPIGEAKTWAEGSSHFRLAAGPIQALGSNVDLVLPVDRDLTSRDGIAASCSGLGLRVQAAGQELRLSIPESTARTEHLWLDVLLTRASGSAGITVRGHARLEQTD